MTTKQMFINLPGSDLKASIPCFTRLSFNPIVRFTG